MTTALDIGEVWLTQWTDTATLTHKLRIDRADPRAWATREVLHDIATNTIHGYTDLATLDGDVLTLNGTNKRVIYRVRWDQHDLARDCYLIEWPD